MSHFSNDLIADRAMSDAIDLVNTFSDMKVKQVLHLNFGVMNGDRDDLIDLVAEVFFNDHMNAPTPVG